MRIYRIENASGIGPYYGSMGDWCDGPHNYTSGRPMPYEDGPLAGAASEFTSRHGYQNVRHGFSSMVKLINWFSASERAALSASGFYLAVYDVPDHAVAEGALQTLFDCSIATKVEEQPLYSVELQAVA